MTLPPPSLGTIEIGWARVFQGSFIKIMTNESDHRKLFILHCSLAGPLVHGLFLDF